MSKRLRRGRSSNAGVPPEPPAVNNNDSKELLTLLVKSAARQHGVTTVDSSFDDIKAQLEAALEQDDEGEEDDDAEAAEELELEPAGRSSRRCATGATSSTARATESTDASTAKPDGLKHHYELAGNPSSVCGVCASQWVPNCGWGTKKGNWACFPCQVYICGFECLNDHNTGRVHGNTCKASSVIYTKEEWAGLSKGGK